MRNVESREILCLVVDSIEFKAGGGEINFLEKSHLLTRQNHLRVNYHNIEVICDMQSVVALLITV